MAVGYIYVYSTYTVTCIRELIKYILGYQYCDKKAGARNWIHLAGRFVCVCVFLCGSPAMFVCRARRITSLIDLIIRIQIWENVTIQFAVLLFCINKHGFVVLCAVDGRTMTCPTGWLGEVGCTHNNTEFICIKFEWILGRFQVCHIFL